MTLTQRLLADHASRNGSAPTLEQFKNSLPPSSYALLTKTLVQQRTERYITIHEPTLQLLKRANMIAFRLFPTNPPANFKPDPVLITGESGTGKEILAKILLANKSENEFYPVNCAGIVDTLFESQLFGHMRGAFTGADASRAGLMVTAGSGLLFFDEVGELPLSQQAKLLRALQERRVMPVGSATEVPIKCRMVFATNRNLETMMNEGTFREDLYYRITALTLKTYPLRERPDDAVLIADHICVDRSYEPPEVSIPQSIIQGRGNVRALENWLLHQHVFGED